MVDGKSRTNTTARGISPAAERGLGKEQPTSFSNSQRLPKDKDFWVQFREVQDAVISYLRPQLHRFDAPMDLMRKNLSTAVGVGIVALLLGSVLLAYTLFGPRDVKLSTAPQAKFTVLNAQPKTMWTTANRPKTMKKMDQGFSTWKDAPKKTMKKGHGDMGTTPIPPNFFSKPDFSHGTNPDFANDMGVTPNPFFVEQPGESYVDSAIHTIQQKTAPIKDAFIRAKDKVVEATGLSDTDIDAETVIDSAKEKISDLASSAKQKAEDITSQIKEGATNLAQNAYDAAVNAADAAKQKAEEVTGMSMKSDKNIKSKSTIGKQTTLDEVDSTKFKHDKQNMRSKRQF